MSLKIYEAYRIKKGVKLWPFLRRARRLAEAGVTRDLRNLYASLIDSWRASPKLWQEARRQLLHSGDSPDTGFASAYVRKMYREQQGSSMRNAFDFDTAITVRFTGARYILVPYPGSGVSGCLRFMRRCPWLEDYHYQNASDKPDHISAAQWASRARVWDRLLDEGAEHDKLILSIVSPERFYDVDPLFIDAARARRRNRK